ncbi:MAG: AAA family ATPase [Rhodospirillales bacterium]|nr:AAA family ATPase [Rhodospirillales bacterium]
MAAVEALKEDRFFFRSMIDIQEGGIDAAASQLAEKKTPPLLIVETSANKDKMFEQLEALASVCDPETRLILIGSENDIGLFRTLIDEGISDYLVSPASGEQIKDSISKIYQGEESGTMGKVIAFMGMVGGVGNSVLSHNVAHELSAIYDEQVIVVDLDIPFGTAALDYNMQPRQTLVEALTQSSNLDAAMLNQFLMEFGDTKLSVLGSPASLGTGMQITTEPFDTLLKTVKPMAEFIILDMPHVWEGWVNDVMASADEVILVARPDLTNLRNAKNMVEFLGPKRGVDAPTRLVLNQVGAAKKSDLSDKDFKDALALSPCSSIPYEPDAFGLALNNGEMMSKANAKSKATEGIIALAKIVSGREVAEEKTEKKGLGGLFKKGKKKDKEDKKGKK